MVKQPKVYTNSQLAFRSYAENGEIAQMQLEDDSVDKVKFAYNLHVLDAYGDLGVEPWDHDLAQIGEGIQERRQNAEAIAEAEKKAAEAPEGASRRTMPHS